MAISMAKTIKEERLRWVLPIVEKEDRYSLMRQRSVRTDNGALSAGWRHIGHTARTASLPDSTEPKHCEGETAISIKERVIAIRKKTKKMRIEVDWQLEKEGILIHERTVGKILRKKTLCENIG